MNQMIKCCALAIVLFIALCNSEMYTSKYDGIDLDEILGSDRLFNNYFRCLNDTGNCSPDGRELKKIIPDALKTECSKCTPKQRDGIEKVLKFVYENKKDEFKVLAAKYDPDGVFAKKYEAEAKKRGYEIPK